MNIILSIIVTNAKADSPAKILTVMAPSKRSLSIGTCEVIGSKSVAIANRKMIFVGSAATEPPLQLLQEDGKKKLKSKIVEGQRRQ
jgi:hypothetical protein